MARPYNRPELFARVHWADWVENLAKERRQAGSKKPYREVLLVLLEMTGGHLTVEEIVKGPKLTAAAAKARIAEIINDETRFARIAKRFKKKRQLARRELQMMEDLAHRKRAAQTNRRPEGEGEDLPEVEDLRARPPRRSKYPARD